MRDSLRPRANGARPELRARSAATVDVAFTPAGIRGADVAVVVDVLRATSTIAEAIAAGYRRVLCCESAAAARRLRSPGRALAGEEGCVRVPDFELGNSPVALASAAPLGEELVLATTNGSPAIVAATRRCERVLIGSLLNLRALVAAVPAGARVTVVCAGTGGRPALEDTYAAGRIVAALEAAPTDAARMAECVAERFGTALEPLAASENAAVLRSTGQWRDIAWCAHESVLDLVPEVGAVVDGAAVVGPPHAGARPTGRATPHKGIPKVDPRKSDSSFCIRGLG